MTDQLHSLPLNGCTEVYLRMESLTRFDCFSGAVATPQECVKNLPRNTESRINLPWFYRVGNQILHHVRAIS